MITLDTLLQYLNEEKLDCELQMDHSGAGARYRWHIKVFSHSPTAQPGYEYSLLFNHSGNQRSVIDKTMEWFLPHRTNVREAKR